MTDTPDQRTSPSEAGSAELADQARDQAGGKQVRLRIDEREMTTDYANGYRTHLTNDEVMIDFGLNMVMPLRQDAANGDGKAGPDAEVLFRVNNRVIMNYSTAKRLAMTLGQAIRQYEQRFGEIKLNANERASDKR